MKRIFIILTSIILCLFLCHPLTCFALDFDDRTIHLDYQNAPDGTAYIDVLIKARKIDDVYTDFNVAPQRLVDKPVINGTTQPIYETLNINENSDITKYNKKGFVSLSLHSKEVSEFKIEKSYGYESDSLNLNCSAEGLYEKYGKFKIAYVSENGEVLKVINISKKDYSIKSPFELIVDGNKATLMINGFSPLIIFLLVAIIFAIFAIPLVPTILVLCKRADKRSDKKIINNIISKIEQDEQAD